MTTKARAAIRVDGSSMPPYPKQPPLIAGSDAQNVQSPLCDALARARVWVSDGCGRTQGYSTHARKKYTSSEECMHDARTHARARAHGRAHAPVEVANPRCARAAPWGVSTRRHARPRTHSHPSAHMPATHIASSGGPMMSSALETLQKVRKLDVRMSPHATHAKKAATNAAGRSRMAVKRPGPPPQQSRVP